MRRNTYKATYTPQGEVPDVPKPGSRGDAWPAEGINDQRSAQFGAWLFRPDGDENAYYVDEHDLTFDPQPTVELAAYRKPSGSICRKPEGIAIIHKVKYTGAQDEVKKALERAAKTATESLGAVTTCGATYRIGLPEAIYTALESCGDHEAARLACEAFLDRNPRQETRRPSFGEYRAYFIEP